MRGLRTVVEDMPQVCAATRTDYLHALQKQASILMPAYVLRRDRRPEARPAGAGIEFRIRGEQRRTAANAAEDARLMPPGVGPAERKIGASLSRHVELVGAELLAPFAIRVNDSLQLRNARRLSGVIEVRDGHVRGGAVIGMLGFSRRQSHQPGEREWRDPQRPPSRENVDYRARHYLNCLIAGL